jgi:hypothetical protein
VRASIPKYAGNFFFSTLFADCTTNVFSSV